MPGDSKLTNQERELRDLVLAATGNGAEGKRKREPALHTDPSHICASKYKEQGLTVRDKFKRVKALDDDLANAEIDCDAEVMRILCKKEDFTGKGSHRPAPEKSEPVQYGPKQRKLKRVYADSKVWGVLENNTAMGYLQLLHLKGVDAEADIDTYNAGLDFYFGNKYYRLESRVKQIARFDVLLRGVDPHDQQTRVAKLDKAP